jgi:hypothetical protein
MEINHGVFTTYTDKKANHTSMALLVNLLFTWKRKENRRGGHRCISMILIKGPICKKE